MENWSYRIREFWLLNKREIKRYGVCAWFVLVGMVHPIYPAAWLGLGAALAIYLFDRWGRRWAERGRMVMKGTGPGKEAP